MTEISNYTGALNSYSHNRIMVLRLLADVCKPFGVAGQCIYKVFEIRIGEALP